LHRRRWRGNGVEMPERKRKLDRQRKQREPRAMFDLRSKQLHSADILIEAGQGIPAAPML
jgi:hypothetical protein